MKCFLSLLLIGICIGLSSCTPSDLIHLSLEKAGKNRYELEKVLKHYAQNSSDSLKLKAARFLIANMIENSTYDSDDIRLFYQKADSVFKDTTIHDRYELRLDTLLEDINIHKIKKILDVETITADYLISNIDDAFNARETYSWCKKLPFDDFCEYVLPYRLGTCPLEEWRPVMRKRFSHIVDSLVAINASDTTICKTICAEYYTVIHYPHTFKPQYPASSLLNMIAAPCPEWTNFGLYAMRTFGMPVAADFTPYWAEHSMGHEWSVLLSQESKAIFMMGDKPLYGHQNWFDMMAKAYRRTASLQEESLAMLPVGEKIPDLFNDPYFIDVSEQYFEPGNITIDLEYAAPVPKKVAYIMVFNNDKWKPVHWGLIEKGKVTFTKMNKECMYLSMYYHDGKFYPASEPFYLDHDGKLFYLHPNAEQMETISLKWKYSDQKVNEWCKRIVNGKFQMANQPNFSDARDVYSIDSVPEAFYHDIPLRYPEKYRYFRYLAPKGSPGDLAELEIYDEKDSLLCGEVIGDNTSFYIFGFSDKYKVFDRDISTIFEAENRENAWVGMDFKTPVKIGKFAFLPHNDDNFIRENELYELFYWQKGWHSLGKQKGKRAKQTLIYKVPGTSLLRLSNLTKEKKEERIFVYKNGEQIWF